MENVLNITYSSSLTKLCEVNSSFDTGILRICYSGKNRNNSFISKETLEKCIPTIYNCPVVCNYDRDSDTLGGHDMEVIRTDSGDLKIINVTQPVGVIPESSRVWFEDFEEDDGTVHEYLCAEVLIWKRQEAYEKIKNDGITSHSMEIGVKAGRSIDGIYHIEDFEFNAFTLIGVEPCFEGSALNMFAKQDFKKQLSEMMQDLKESFNKVNTSSEVDDTHPQENSMEGGTGILEAKMELIAKYGINIDAIDFSIEELSIEELTEKLEEITKAFSGEGSGEPESKGTDNEAEDLENKFALTSNIVDELYRVLDEVKIEREWGEYSRYWYVDCDFELNEVYCWDTSDWLLYGFTYAVDGDSITIDFDSKKRKKYVIADFDEGEQPSPFATVFEAMEHKLREHADLEAKYQTASDTILSMETELGELRQFKTNTENAIIEGEKDEVFAQFEDLKGVEAFDNLCEARNDYSVSELEEKCYAIRGKYGTPATFSYEGKSHKMPVGRTDKTNEPYGGLFIKYGTDNK